MLFEERTKELIQLKRHLQTAREDECARLARNLQDEFGALITATKLDAARIKRHLVDAPCETIEKLKDLALTLKSSVAFGCSIIENLRHCTLRNLRLITALEISARGFAERCGIKVTSTAEPLDFGPAAEFVNSRTAQKAITNIINYAQVKQKAITMNVAEGMASLSEINNWKGLNTTAI